MCTTMKTLPFSGYTCIFSIKNLVCISLAHAFRQPIQHKQIDMYICMCIYIGMEFDEDSWFIL